MGSMNRVRWKCTDINESMGIADSDMTGIILKSDKYADNVQWGWYIRKEYRAGTHIFWQTDVRYLESRSDERALRRCTNMMLRYFGAHYIVGTFRWLSEMHSSSSDLL